MSAGRRLRVLFTASEAYLIERNAMDRGFGWERSARQDLAVYRELLQAGEWAACEPQLAGALLG
jgi:glycogen synthase